MKKGKPEFSHAKTPPVDVRGQVRVYIDLPRELAHKLNVLAALRGKAKRALLAEIVSAAVAEVKL
jgi:predicted DNA-binding protein